MKRSSGIVGLTAIFLAAAWLLPLSPAEQPGGVISAVFEAEQPSAALRGVSQSVPESVLLLRNGEMIKGRVTRDGDRFQVRVPGGEVYVKAADVQHECRDTDEVYQRKRALIRVDNVMDHLELTQWCIKAVLFDPAARELAEAAALDPKHPLIPVLERRLKVAMAPAPAADPNAKPMPAGPTAHELDRMVRGMPPRTVETFSQVIQPMLVNNCSTAACHGQSVRNGFHLFRTPADSPPSRLLTQRNLHAALEWLDREDPEASPLLTYASQAHGTARVAIFTDRQVAQYRQLRDWCYRVAQTDRPVVHASYDEPLGASSGYGPSGGSAGGSRSGRRHHAASGAGSIPKTPLPGWDSRTVDLRNNPAPEGQNRTAQRGGTAQKSPASDPFDPESFNRRFAAPGRPQNGTKPSQPAEPRDTPTTAAGREGRPLAKPTPTPDAQPDG
jgi:hypothetical protein